MMENIVYYSKKLRVVRRALAVFDVDWTLIKPLEGRKFPVGVDDWQWLRESVPGVIKKYNKTHRIVFLTDQSKNWKVDMVKAVAKALDVPVIALIAMRKEDHKPSVGLFWSVFEGGVDLEKSFYVGDAAGRKGDWSDKDKVFAERAGLRFYTPEEMFPLEKGDRDEEGLGVEEKEVVVMVGYPGAGKSTVARERFPSERYKIISGDTFKTTPRMIKEAEKYVGEYSIIFDASFGKQENRALVIAFAKKHGLRVRCVWVTTSLERAMEQNKQRAMEGGPRVPDVVFYTYRKYFEEPAVGEGCEVIIS
jgi:bifunctional polynucleotide phosphatase/kinase